MFFVFFSKSSKKTVITFSHCIIYEFMMLNNDWLHLKYSRRRKTKKLLIAINKKLHEVFFREADITGLTKLRLTPLIGI